MSFRWYLLITAIFALGIFLRVEAVKWNQYVHADVGMYSRAADSLANFGNFKISDDVSQPHLYSLKEKGGRFLEHNPLWPFIAAGLLKLGFGDAYFSLKLLSFLSGVFLMVLTYFVALRLAGRSVAFLSLFFVAFSYLLIDYSANGSFYIFQALIYLLFLHLLNRGSSAVWLGMTIGLALLINNQSLVLLASYLVYFLIVFRKNWKKFLWRSALAVLFALIVYSPWFFRNYLLFGKPIYSIDMIYVWQKLGVEKVIQENVISFNLLAKTYLDLAKRVFTFWLPHNLYYINRQLFVLAPLVYVFSLFLGIEVLFRKNREQLKKLLPIFLVLFFHILISAGWPITKFRFFVPMMPLVFILGSYYIFNFISRPVFKKIAVGASLALMLVFSLLAYFSTPSHTYYYGGTVTSDIFSEKGELKFLEGLKTGQLNPFYNNYND